MTNPKSIKIEDHNYNLLDEKIAKFPLKNRGDSKLLIYKNEQISESTYNQISDALPNGSVLIFNNTTCRVPNADHSCMMVICCLCMYR